MIGLTPSWSGQTRQAHPLVSYGSGAGSDAFLIETTEVISERQGLAASTQDYIARRTEIDYGMYVRLRGKLAS